MERPITSRGPNDHKNNMDSNASKHTAHGKIGDAQLVPHNCFVTWHCYVVDNMLPSVAHATVNNYVQAATEDTISLCSALLA